MDRAIPATSYRHQREEVLAGLHERKQIGCSHPYGAEVYALRSESSIEKADAPLMRCLRVTLPCVSMMHTATGTAACAAAVSTWSAIVFARASKSMMTVLCRRGARVSG